MGKDTGFLEYEKESPPQRSVKERVCDFREYDTFFPEKNVVDGFLTINSI